MKSGKTIMNGGMYGSETYANPLSAVPIIEVTGDNRVLVEHHLGVVVYEPIEIMVRVRYGRIQILGEQLTLAQMTKERLVIRGRIHAIQLERKYK